MNVVCSDITDFDGWIALAREVEPLFGPMADETAFHEGLQHAISQKTAFCIRSDSDENDQRLKGGIVISKESNEIAWLVVSRHYRKMGYGRDLLQFAIRQLNPQKDMFVQTFHESIVDGSAARKLYLDAGFSDYKDGGLNPAGIPTTIMRLPKSGRI